jgi:glycosyltransferase involved in cell wall biosynthesis
MRICLYTDTALPKVGGQEMVVDALARQFQDMGHHVVVLAPHPRLPLRARDHELPYPVARHPRFFSTRRLVDWYRWWLLRARRKHRFDVLHCHGIYPPAYLAALCRQRLGVPAVITSHGGDVRPDGVRQSKPVVRERQLRAVAAADALVSISRFTDEGFRHWGARTEQIVPIPNGVHIEPLAFPAARPNDLDRAIMPGRYLFFLGRLVRRKGVDLLLQALALVPRGGGVQLVIAGKGEELAQLQQRAAETNLTDRVRFVGGVFGEAKTYLLQNAICTVMPSRVWEAFPLVVLESFAASTPVLGARVPGLEDLIRHEETGWLVPPESPEALAEVMAAVLAAPHHCRPLGDRARAVACAYSWRQIAERHVRLYERLLDERRLRTAV